MPPHWKPLAAKAENLHEENDFAVTEALLSARSEPEHDGVLVSAQQPYRADYPAGLVRSAGAPVRLRAVLAVDECFLDFLPERDGLTAKPLLQTAAQPCYSESVHQTVRHGRRAAGLCLVLRYSALLAKMRAAGQPWAVSSLAQAAGAAALRETEYVDAVRALIADQRPELAAGLRALGCR